jgi:hypothetical protein
MSAAIATIELGGKLGTASLTIVPTAAGAVVTTPGLLTDISLSVVQHASTSVPVARVVQAASGGLSFEEASVTGDGWNVLMRLGKE